MEEKEQTLDDLVRDFIAKQVREPFSIEGKERLWVHDMIHAIIPANALSTRGEECAAIFQAVLLNEKSISKKCNPHGDGAEKVTFEHVLTQIIPELHEKHLRPLAKAGNFRLPTPMSPKEMKDIFTAATALTHSIKKEFGKNLGEFSVEKLKQLPAHRLTLLAEQAFGQARALSGKVTFSFFGR